MPTKSHRQQVRMEPELLAKIQWLAKRWGPVVPLTPSDVIRQCVETAYHFEHVHPGKAGPKK